MKTDLENLVCAIGSRCCCPSVEKGPPKKGIGVSIDAAVGITFGKYRRLELNRR